MTELVTRIKNKLLMESATSDNIRYYVQRSVTAPSKAPAEKVPSKTFISHGSFLSAFKKLIKDTTTYFHDEGLSKNYDPIASRSMRVKPKDPVEFIKLFDAFVSKNTGFKPGPVTSELPLGFANADETKTYTAEILYSYLSKARVCIKPSYEKYKKPGFVMFGTHPDEVRDDEATTGQTVELSTNLTVHLHIAVARRGEYVSVHVLLPKTGDIKTLERFGSKNLPLIPEDDANNLLKK